MKASVIKSEYLKLLEDREIAEIAGYIYLYKLDKNKVITKEYFSHHILYKIYLACVEEYEKKVMRANVVLRTRS